MRDHNIVLTTAEVLKIIKLCDLGIKNDQKLIEKYDTNTKAVKNYAENSLTTTRAIKQKLREHIFSALK